MTQIETLDVTVVSKDTDLAATFSHYPDRCVDSSGGSLNDADGDGCFFCWTTTARIGRAVSCGKGAT